MGIRLSNIVSRRLLGSYNHSEDFEGKAIVASSAVEQGRWKKEERFLRTLIVKNGEGRVDWERRKP